MTSFQGRVVLSSLVVALLMGAGRPSSAAPLEVLILHDSAGPWGYLGAEYALMTENVLGHFEAGVTTQPVTSYTPGLVESFDATFYIGSTYEERSYHGAGSPERAAWGIMERSTASREAR